jgi:chromosomal replication initiator protein
MNYWIVPGLQSAIMINPGIVCKVCEDVFRLDEGQIHKKSRKRKIINARQCAHKILADETKMSLNEIGEFVGSKNHATVLHSAKTFTNLVQIGDKVKNQYLEVCKKLWIAPKYEYTPRIFL